MTVNYGTLLAYFIVKCSKSHYSATVAAASVSERTALQQCIVD